MMFLTWKSRSPAGLATGSHSKRNGEAKAITAPRAAAGEGRPARPGEQAFQAESCAIWQDIRRALEGPAK